MCLYIKKDTKRMRAENDILVYKNLDYSRRTGYCTPYQYMRVEFNELGRAKLTSKIERIKGVIDRAIHSYYNEKIAKETSLESKYDYGTRTKLAVIPKGSLYYIGDDGDVASTQLYIFKTKKALDEWKEGRDPGFDKIPA